MIKSIYRVIGVMSGTSLDGLDLAYVEFNVGDSWSFNIIKSETIEYPKKWKNVLKNLVSNSFEELQVIDQNYTQFLAKTINDFVKRNHIIDLDAVCSHGHTALHEPENALTYQIGNLDLLSSLIDKVVVCDFRLQDVKLKGQGAPLVPIGDELLFSEYGFCINLGGFANISTKKHSKRIAYDISPLNIVMNHYVSKIELQFDKDGKLAALGQANKQLLNELNNLEYYNKKPPKSLGLEWVRDKVFPLIDKYNLEVKDILRTFVEHCAFQIAQTIQNKQGAKVLVTGGGAYNLFLIKRLRELTTSEIIIPSNSLVEYKEALIFGLLGVLKLRGENNCLSSVTGAINDHSSGNIYYP